MQTIGAKIQLDGEAQFKAGLQNIVQQSKTLAAEMKNLSSSFDQNATAQEKARAKMQVLDKQINTQKGYIDTLNGKYDAQKKKLDEIAAEYDKVSQEQGENSTEAQKLAEQYTRQETALSKTEEQINKAQTALNNMETEMRECQQTASGLTIAEKFEKAAEKIQAAGDKVKTFGDNMAKAGKTLSTHVTAPIVAIGAKGVQAFAEVDKTMQLTNKTMGNGASEAKLLSDAMKDAASNSTFGMGEASTATLNFARAGLDAEQAASALAPAMNLAAGEGGELDTVSAGLVATINGFHGSFEDAGKYADVFAAACNNSALDVNSLSSAMSVAAPIFASAGYSVNDAALYMGVMANNGIEADKAANSLKTGIARLVSPAKEGAEMMDKLGISVTNSDGSMKDSVTIQKELHDAFSNLSESEQIAAASAIFGKQQMAPWLALINTAPRDVDALNSSLSECAGTTDEMSDAMMSGFGGSLEKLKSTLDVLITTVGERLAPHISKFTEKIQDLADKFNALSPEMQDKIIKFAGIAAAIGPVLLVTGKLTSAIGSIMEVGGGLVKGLSKFPDGLNKISTAFNAIPGMLTKIGTVFKTIGTAIMAHPVIAIAAVIAGIVAYLVHLYNTNEDFRNKVNAILDSLKEKWEAFKEGFFNVVEAIKTKIDEWQLKWETIKQIIEYIITAIATTIHNKIEEIKQAFEDFKNKVQSIIDAVKQKFENFKQSVINMADNVKTKFNNMKEGISNVINTVKDKIQSLADKVLHVKDKISEYIEKIKNFFKNLVLKIPKPSLPKLPHFEVTWTTKSFLGQDISIPHVGINWYDKGGIFSHPSIIGVGEKRPEFVGALDDLRKIVREESGDTTVNIIVNGAEGQDVRELANIVMDKINTQMRRESGAFA